MIFTEQLLLPLFEALENCKGVVQMDKWHPEGDVFVHSLQVLKWAFRESIDVDLILAAMIHDVGKAENSKGHDKIAVEMLSPYISSKTEWLVKNHMRIWSLLLGDMRRQKKVLDLINHPLLPDLILLARWDKMGRNPRAKVKYDRQYIIDRLNTCIKKSFKEYLKI